MKRRVHSIRNNLPLALSSFVGRHREIRQVKEALARSRLVTLTGAGGSGKTRLALEVAASFVSDRIASPFADGVWLIQLAPLNSPDLVLQYSTNTLGIVERPDRTLLDILIDYLAGKRVLLVFDNCEHLVDACATLAKSLLEQCPQLAVLATSREALNLSGESVWIIPSLQFPSQTPIRSELVNPQSFVRQLLSYDAIRLFVDRARVLNRAFELTPENAAGT